MKVKSHKKRVVESATGLRKKRGFSLGFSVIIMGFTLFVLPVKLDGTNSFIRNLPDFNTPTNTVMVSPSDQLWSITDKPEIYPVPVHVEYSDIYHPLLTRKGSPAVFIVASENLSRRASVVFNRQLERIGIKAVPVVSDIKELPSACTLAIVFKVEPGKQEVHEAQAYTLMPSTMNGKRIIEASGAGEQGCIYAATALGQLISIHNGNVEIREAKVEDWPVYSRRLFSSDPTADKVQDVLDWMVRYRMECLKLSSSSWWKVNKDFEETMVSAGQWKKKYGGVKFMLALHIYGGGRQIEVSNPADRDALKQVIRIGLDNGIDRVMIQADDISPFKNGEGYVLTSEEDKAQFANMAEAHCFLMKDIKGWLDRQGAVCELYYCPSFYTYEDNNLGDMGLYKGTPWEDNAFGPLKRDLEIIGKNMPDDVSIIWTGPVVRSRRISDTDLQDWTKNLAGRTPFLWDNTMYSHYPFANTALFTAYDNDLPLNFHLKTAGNGMYINGDAYGENNRTAYMTANDFLWSGMRYLPQQSLNSAIITLYEREAVKNILEFRDAELTLRQIIGERQLKSDVDTLWNAVLKIRAVTQKNPFYYMSIYTRLKALRYQLEYSVPDTIPLRLFQEKVAGLDQKRRECLKLLEKAGLIKLVGDLKKEMVQIH